jgi:hypothetical protein
VGERDTWGISARPRPVRARTTRNCPRWHGSAKCCRAGNGKPPLEAGIYALCEVDAADGAAAPFRCATTRPPSRPIWTVEGWKPATIVTLELVAHSRVGGHHCRPVRQHHPVDDQERKEPRHRLCPAFKSVVRCHRAAAALRFRRLRKVERAAAPRLDAPGMRFPPSAA